MKEEIKKALQKEWLKNVIETQNCIDKLNTLNAKKKELIAMAESEKPPENIIELLKESEQEFEKLLKKSEKIKEKSIEIKEKIDEIENDENI